jgi:hypothetical protein
LCWCPVIFSNKLYSESRKKAKYYNDRRKKLSPFEETQAYGAAKEYLRSLLTSALDGDE